MPALLDELIDFLRIPSVSTGGGDPEALSRACDWVCERIDAAGGDAEAVTLDGGHPMAVGELRGTAAGAFFDVVQLLAPKVGLAPPVTDAFAD